MIGWLWATDHKIQWNKVRIFSHVESRLDVDIAIIFRNLLVD